MNDAWKTWKRATNSSRKEVAKAMERLGCRAEIWTKRDKGRTIVQIFGHCTTFSESKKFSGEIEKAVVAANEKYASRMVLKIEPYGDMPAPRMQQFLIHLSEPERYPSGETCYTLLIE